jgi:hypothetical protein
MKEEVEFFTPELQNMTRAHNYYAHKMLKLLINNELNECKFLYKRIPDKVYNEIPELEFIWCLGKDLWTTNYIHFFSSILNTKWSSFSEPLVQELAVCTRERIFLNISKTYKSIPVQQALLMLGIIHVDDLLNKGWQLKDNFLFPALQKEHEKNPLLSAEEIDSVIKAAIQLSTI